MTSPYLRFFYFIDPLTFRVSTRQFYVTILHFCSKLRKGHCLPLTGPPLTGIPRHDIFSGTNNINICTFFQYSYQLSSEFWSKNPTSAPIWFFKCKIQQQPDLLLFFNILKIVKTFLEFLESCGGGFIQWTVCIFGKFYLFLFNIFGDFTVYEILA